VRIADLPGIEPEWADALSAQGVVLIEDFIALEPGRLAAIEGLGPEAASSIQAIIEENVEVVEDKDELPEGAAPSVDEVYECPDCGAAVNPSMAHCPSCGVELSFEYEDDQEA
jgi:N utilization substance protein A